MCLADQLAQRPAGVAIELAARLWTLPDSSTFAPLVEQTDARYIMLASVATVCRQVATEWSDLLAPANLKLRAPMTRLWIEWRDSAVNQEVGALVEAADDGRSGRMRLFWNTEAGVDVGQAELVFDLDAPVGHGSHTGRLFPLTGLPDNLLPLEPHLALSFDPCWEDYFRASAATLPEAAALCSERLWTDAIDVLAFFALLGIRLPLRERAIDRQKLNVARARSGKPRLLDHVQLTIGQPDGDPRARGGTHDRSRRNPRLHVVRGHLVRRQDQIFWRGAHMRGLASSQPSMPKTRHVRMYSDSPEHGQAGSRRLLVHRREFDRDR